MKLQENCPLDATKNASNMDKEAPGYPDGTQPFPGKLIAVEGLDGSGKSTQIHLIHRWLKMNDCRVFLTEWNSSELVKATTKKGKKRQLLTPTTFSLIHATDFADRYERQILPMLKSGYIILCDRYIYTAFARDRVRGCDPKWLQELYKFAVKPDITFYMKVNLETAVERILTSRSKLKYFEAGMDLGLADDPQDSFKIFQKRIRNTYDEMTQEFGFVTINGADDAHVKQHKIRAVITDQINISRFRLNGK